MRVDELIISYLDLIILDSIIKEEFYMKNVKKIIIVVAASLALVACAGQEPAVTPTPAAPGTAPAETGGNNNVQGTRVVTTGLPATAVQVFFDGDTYEENRWTRLIRERLDIEVDVVFVQDTTTDAYNNWMNAMLATGNLPDVVRHGDISWLVRAQEAGFLMDISDVFESYASPSVQHWRTLYPQSFDGVSFNGRLYGFPFINDTFHEAPFLWIRDDWLEYAGGQAPRTVDEMVELARVFTHGNPSGPGVETFGFALSREIVPGNFGSITGLIGAFGVPAGPGPDGIFFHRDGQMTFSYIQPEVREALEVLRYMFAEGLINPEFIANDFSAMEANISEGRYGMMYHRNWGNWHPFSHSFQRDGVITRPYPVPTVPGRDLRLGVSSNVGGEFFVISANAQHPEAIMEILNLYQEVVIEFEDEAQLERYREDSQWRLAPIAVVVPTELHAPAVFQAFDDNGATIAGVARRAWRHTMDFQSGEATTPAAYGTWGQMNLDREFGGSMNIALNHYRPMGALVENLMQIERPDIWLQNSSVLQTMMEIAFTDIIIGNAPIDSFDVFVEQWLAAGGQATLDALEIIYQASN